jgi:hypothetical protein
LILQEGKQKIDIFFQWAKGMRSQIKQRVWDGIRMYLFGAWHGDTSVISDIWETEIEGRQIGIQGLPQAKA